MRRRKGEGGGAKTTGKARKLVYSLLPPSKQGRQAYSELKGEVVICVSNHGSVLLGGWHPQCLNSNIFSVNFAKTNSS